MPAAGDLDRAIAAVLDDAIAAIGRVTGKTKKLMKVPNGVMRTLLTVTNAIALRRGEIPLATREFFEFSLVPQYVDNSKSVRELGATYRPIEETIRDAIDDFKKRGLLPR